MKFIGRVTMQPGDKHPFGAQIGNIANCPRCGISNPLISKRYVPDSPWIAQADSTSHHWATFACESCAQPININAVEKKDHRGYQYWNLYMDPDPWTPFDALPEEAKRYLRQARATISSPDASLIMSASSVDAMLKARNLVNGTLYSRIETAVEQNLITQDMAKWSHLVRLEANSIRDADKPRPATIEDAERVFTFAEKLGEILFHIPSLLPEEPEDENTHH